MFAPFIWGATNASGSAGGDAYDTDAQAFFTAVEGGGDTLTTTEKDATNQLVLDLKSDGIWTGMYAIYPFVGATSTSTKWNLKDPRDLDAAYRVSWTGTANFTADGITGTSNFAVINSFTKSFIHSFMHAFIPSFMHSLIPSFIPSFIY